jgi:hypothetical protein
VTAVAIPKEARFPGLRSDFKHLRTDGIAHPNTDRLAASLPRDAAVEIGQSGRKPVAPQLLLVVTFGISV